MRTGRMRKGRTEDGKAVRAAAEGTKAGKPVVRAAALVLAVCCAICVVPAPRLTPAYAGEYQHEAASGELEFDPEESSASADSKVTGHIKVELISVEMPAGDFEFQIDPTIPFQLANPGEQIQSPGIRIRNRSVVPVKLEISSVADIKDEDVRFMEKFADTMEQSFQLVDRISGVGPPGTAILVLGVEGQTYSETSFEQDAILPGKQNIYITDIPAEEERTLELYGKAAPDFYGAYQFTVRPTLKISAVQATPAD